MPPRKPPEYPPLPASVTTILGPVAVEVKPIPESEDAWGLWQRDRRVIEIDSKQRPEVQWATLFHEMVHAALDDTGLSNLFTEQQQEALCDGIASARMRERFG